MPLITTKQAAVDLGVSARYIINVIHQGHLVATKRGRDWLIDTADLKEFKDKKIRKYLGGCR